MKKRVKGILLATFLVCFSCSFVSYGMEQKAVENIENEESTDGELKIEKQMNNQEVIIPEVENETETMPTHVGWYVNENGDTYYYNQDGSLYYGWRYESGKWYYLDGTNVDNPGSMAADTIVKVGTQYYCFNKDGVMQSMGWILRPEGWYYANADGSLVLGWRNINGVWYYLDGNNTGHPGLMADNCVKNIGGSNFYFAAGGAMRTGWLLYPEGWYYADGSGAQAIGWRYINGVWYYLDENDTEHPGLMVDNCVKNIGGSNFYFAAGGAMRTGWLLYPEGWYYADGSGAQAIGWRYINGAWYYLNGDNAEYPGLMVDNCIFEIGGNTYKFKSGGAMYKGWYYDGDNWYYYDHSGLMASGWRAINGYWYFMDPDNDNKMINCGWKLFGNYWYFFHNSGAMATNWLAVGGNWYFLSSDGAMKTGWQNVGGTWYYMYTANDSHGGSEGVMARNCYIDGYYLGANGAMLSPEAARLVLRAQPYSSRTGYLILVDRAACRTTIFAGSAGAWNLLYDWQCAPGKPSTPTVGGEFTVGSKGYYFDSGNARCYWYTQFYGDYLFHSVLYSKYNGRLMDGRVGMQLSHGCVRLPIEKAKWIYDNIPTGTKVVVF
ncbi:L,D-transpeptidase family protein [Dorea sp. AM58-8]|uniref:L,D-transpeptidase family protein n=1 Tax=Dorea sp. AM58-8 TaxID=2292346 RepID=UPI001313FBB6|nr:L,D-transpeptidase [Dorea sp. AM58-8]